MVTPHEQHYPDNTPLESDFVSVPSSLRTDKDFIVKDFFIINNSDAKFLRGQVFNRKAASGNYSTATIDYLIGITSLATAPTIGLPRPSLVGIGKTYIVKDEVGGAGTTTITIRSAAEETIDGVSTATISTNYQAKSFYSDGANWFIY